MSEQNEENGGLSEETLRPDGLPNAVEKEDGEDSVDAKGADDKGGEGDDKADDKPITEERLTAVLETLVAKRDEGTKEKPKEYTQEEIDDLLQVYKPSEKLITDLRAEDPKVALAAIKELTSGVIKQANTMADIRIQQIVSELREKELTPLQAHYQEEAARRAEDAFYAKNEDLKPYEIVVNAVTAQIEQSGKKFDSKKQVFEEIARVSREAIKSMGITPKKGANGSAGRASSSGGSRMSALSSGSGGRAAGAGATGNKNENRKVGMAVFDSEE
jgi:hypothetical protein